MTIGGINFGVGGYTKHPDEAFAAAACLRNTANQKVNAIEGGLPPTLASLYSDPALAKPYPFKALIKAAVRATMRGSANSGIRRRDDRHREGAVTAWLDQSEFRSRAPCAVRD